MAKLTREEKAAQAKAEARAQKLTYWLDEFKQRTSRVIATCSTFDGMRELVATGAVTEKMSYTIYDMVSNAVRLQLYIERDMRWLRDNIGRQEENSAFQGMAGFEYSDDSIGRNAGELSVRMAELRGIMKAGRVLARTLGIVVVEFTYKSEVEFARQERTYSIVPHYADGVLHVFAVKHGDETVMTFTSQFDAIEHLQVLVGQLGRDVHNAAVEAYKAAQAAK